jgi:hypothetical protein
MPSSKEGIVGHRQDLNAFSAADRQALANLIMQYLNDQVVADHLSIVHAGEQLFTGHRAYIAKLENFLTTQGAGRFVPLPAWDPATPIPAELNVVKATDAGVARPPLRNLTPNRPKPAEFAPPSVCNFASATVLGDAVNPWHGSVHTTIGGTMADITISPAAPIFWCWHAYVDEIYWDFQNACDIKQDAEIILFEHANFHGAHKHVYGPEANLNAGDDSFFNDRVSSMVVLSGNWQVFRHSNFREPYPVVLGPGKYPWVGGVRILNDDMSSLRPTTEAATVTGADIHAHAILFEHINFHGQHKHVFTEESNLAASDDWFFNDRTSSIMILSGTWQFFRHIDYREPYPQTLGPGLHAWVRDAGIANDDLSSLRHSHTTPQRPGVASAGELVLFQHANFHGAHKHLFREEANFNATDDRFFNDVVSSLAVRSGRWRCYRHANYVTPYPPLLSAGLYPWVGSLAITNDDMSSARIE